MGTKSGTASIKIKKKHGNKNQLRIIRSNNMKKDHSKCCDRKRIFPFRKVKYLTADNEWEETTVYPDHIHGAYDSIDDQAKDLKEAQDKESRSEEIWDRIKKYYKKEK